MKVLIEEKRFIKMSYSWAHGHRMESSRPYRKRRGVFQKKRRPRAYMEGISLQQELKFKDTVSTDAIVSATGGIAIGPNLVVQGTGEEERIGRKIIIRSIAARFQVVLPSQTNADDLNGGDTIRIIIFVDKQANGANATVLDILETATYDSFRNLANKNRFNILIDKWTTLNRRVSMTDGTNTASTPLVIKEFKFFAKLNLPIEFDGTTGAVTEIQSNNIQYLYISSQGVGGIPNQCTRIRFDG